MRVVAMDGDQAMLDLVVHFLGIATHHNINAAPSAVPEGTVRKLPPRSIVRQPVRAFGDIKVRASGLHSV